MDYDKFISDYETEARLKRANAISVEIESYLGYRTGDVLDLGCGTGLIAFHLKNKVNNFVLVDSSKEMIQATEHKIKDRSCTNMTTYEGNILDSNFEQRFDVIYASMVLHHITDVQETLIKLMSYLKKNGKLIVVDLLPDSGKFHETNEIFEGHNGFKIEEMAAMFEKAGFVDIAGRKFFSSYKRVNDMNHPYSLFSIIGENH